MNTRFIISILLVAASLAACMPQPATLPADGGISASPTSVPPDLPSPSPVPSSTAPSGWVEYRDARYGYGLALPCYWNVIPTPSEGMFAAMSTRSYSEDFFNANSERGEWKGGVWPARAYKMDVIIVEGLDASLSGEDAVRYLFTTPGFASEQELLSVEAKTFGAHTGHIATVQGGLAGGETTRSVYFQIAPGTMALFGVLPNATLDEPDIRAILSSLALPGEAVTFPAAGPSGPAEGDLVVCN